MNVSDATYDELWGDQAQSVAHAGQIMPGLTMFDPVRGMDEPVSMPGISSRIGKADALFIDAEPQSMAEKMAGNIGTTSNPISNMLVGGALTAFYATAAAAAIQAFRKFF